MRYLYQPLLFCCLLIFVLPLSVAAQYDATYLVLSTQSQVNAFNPADLQGRNLAISGNDITQLSALSVLESLPGALVIENNPLLTNVDGLRNLKDIAARLRIMNNATLANLNGFDSLRGCSSINIEGNGTLPAISGFNKLTVLHTDLSIFFPSGASIVIANNQNLTSISGFNGVGAVSGLSVQANAKLISLAGFGGLEYVSATGPRYAVGTLAVTGNPSLTDISGLSHLKHVAVINIGGNASLKNIDALSSLISMSTRRIAIYDNATLENLDGLSNLRSSGVLPTDLPISINLGNNPALTKPCGIYPFLNAIGPIEWIADAIYTGGSGFTLTQLLLCGDRAIPITPEPTVLLPLSEANGVQPVAFGKAKGYTFKRSPNLPTSTTNVPAKVGGANAFDFGVVPGNNFVQSDAVIPSLTSDSFTLTGWVNCKSSTAGSGGNRIISWINNGGDGVDLVYQSNGSLRVGIDQWPDFSPATSSPNKVTTNASGVNSNWIFFAVTFTRTTNEVKFYFGNNTIDATLDVTKSYPRSATPGTNIGKLAIGAFNDATRNSGTWDRMFRGMIDNIHIFSGKVLDQERIIAIQRGILNTDVIAPSAPTNFRVVSQSGNNYTLAWDPSTDDIGVTEYAIATTSRSMEWSNIPANVTTYTIEVPPFTSLDLNVTAYDKWQLSAPSNVVKITNGSVPVPIVRLNFDEGPKLDPVNSGSAPAIFTRSYNGPISVANTTPVVGGTYAMDYTTNPTDRYVESLSPVDALKNLSAFTITGWVNIESLMAGSGGNRIISWINNGGEGVDLVYQSNGSLRLGVDGWPDLLPAVSSSNKLTADPSAFYDNWQFIAVTYQSNGQVQFYFGNAGVDAQLDVTRNYPGPGVTGSNIGKLAVGAFNTATRNSNTWDRMFRGILDDMRVYGSVLSAQEIVAVQRINSDMVPPGVPQNLVSLGATTTTATLKWDASTDNTNVKQYVVYTAIGNVAAVVAAPATTVVVTQLNENHIYEFVVQAQDDAGNLSEPSNKVTVITQPEVPLPLVHLPFDDPSGNFTNGGTTGIPFARSAGTPMLSINTPSGSGGGNAVDFGTSVGNYYAQSTSTIDALKGMSSFTLTGWINNKSSVTGSGGNRIISWINNGGDGVDLVYQSNGSLRLGVDGWPDWSPAFSSANKIPTNPSAPASNWIFFAVTYQSSGQVQFYFGTNALDATLDVTRTYNGPGITGNNINKMAIGAFNDGTRNSTTYDRMLRGLLDEIQVFGYSTLAN
ncbi:MAG: fibronectin type III domain-containing protein [Chryseolinea sp.]